MVQPIDKPLAIPEAFSLGRKEGTPPAYISDAFSLGLHDGGDSDVPEWPIPHAVSLPSLSPKPAATLINAHALMLNSLMQGKKLPLNTYLPNQVLEDADLLNHSFALQKQASTAAAVNQEAVGNLSTSLQQHQALASKAILPQQQAWHLHKGLQLLQEAKEDGLVPPPDAERLGDHFKRSLGQAQANLLLNTAPHSIRQALHTNPLLVELKEPDRQRIEQRAERRLHSLPLDQQQQQQQALLQQTGNRLKGWVNRSDDYITQAQAGQLPPSKLADLELTQALPQHTLNLLSQLSAHAVTQSAKYQSYLNRMEQGLTTKPLDPNNQGDQQAADYHFLLNHGKDSDPQLSATLPNLFRLTGIVPKSSQPAVNRLIHGKEGVKFSQRLAELWHQNPSLATQLPGEVLLHNFTANAILPNWQQSGISDDPQSRLYYLLTSPNLPSVPNAWDFKAITTLVQTMHQLQDDLQSLEYQAANHPDATTRNRMLPMIALRRLELAQYSKDANLPSALSILPITPILNKPDFIDRTLSAAADGLSRLLGFPGVVEEGLQQLIGPGPLGIIARQHGIKPTHIFEKPSYWRQNLFGFIPQADAETVEGRIWQSLVSGVAGGGSIGKVGMIAGGLGNLTMQSAKEAGYPEYVQTLFGLLAGLGTMGGLMNTKSVASVIEKEATHLNPPLNPAINPGTTVNNSTHPLATPHSNPTTALHPSAGTPGNNPTSIAINNPAITSGNNLAPPVGNQPYNQGNPLTNPNNATTPNPQPNLATQPSITSGQTPINPNQPLITSTQSQNPLQNIKRTIYTIHDIPSIHDTTPVPRRTLPNYTPQELEIFLDHTNNWHETSDWKVELFDLIRGHGNKHIYDTPKIAADRILNPQPGARIPTASSLFFGADSADQLVKETLRYNSNLIENWLPTVTAGKSLELKYIPPSGELTGFGIPRGGTNFMPTYKMTVWGVRTQNGYIIYDYFPSFK